MIKLHGTFNSNRFLIAVLAFLILTDTSIFLNIPVLRQVFGFVYLSIVPGLLTLYLLKMDKLGTTEKFVYSVGLSVSLIMFFGAIINFVLPLFGNITPLSTNSLTVFFSILTLITAVIIYIRGRTVSLFAPDNLSLNNREKAFLIVPALFPILSISGTNIMNNTGNNVVLMITLFLIPAYCVFLAIVNKHIPRRILPVIILFIGISLALITGLRSNHLIGFDIHTEFSIFQSTIDSGRWQILLRNPLDSCLSISVLPAIYHSIIDIDPEYLFKILYPILMSSLPLVVYLISAKYIGKMNAFFASLFFMSQNIFLSIASNPRTSVAIFFFALSICTMVLNHHNNLSKKILLLLFSFSCIVSHYSTSYIYLLVLIITWISMQIISRIPIFKKMPFSNNDSSTNDSPASSNQTIYPGVPRMSYLSFSIIAILFVAIFFWYSQVTESAFTSGVIFFKKSLESLQNFFLIESRSSEVVALMGVELETRGIAQHIEFINTWLIVALIAIGVLAVTFIWLRTATTKNKGGRVKQLFTNTFDIEFVVFSLACSFSLVIFLAIPFIFVGYSMARSYGQMMTILSPYFIVGCMVISRLLRIRRAYLAITLAVMIPFFFISTGVLYQIFGVQRAITLNDGGQSYNILYIHDQEVYAVKWLTEKANQKDKIYTDTYGTIKFKSQGSSLSPAL